MAKDVRQALLYADREEVDGAFVYATDVRLARNARILFVVTDSFSTKVSYAVGLTQNGAHKTSAQSFYNFLSTDQVIDIIRSYGFDPIQDGLPSP